VGGYCWHDHPAAGTGRDRRAGGLPCPAAFCHRLHGQSGPAVSGGRPRGCGRQRVHAGRGQGGISGFFQAWNRRDTAALGRLFTVDGVLDMATKDQDTLTGQGWASASGRGMIAAFAQRQWRLGEKLSYRGLMIGFNGAAGNGGYASNVLASFADGKMQPMTEAKFAYRCTGHAFAHVVIVSAKAAAPA
jgi:hypothetical protein